LKIRQSGVKQHATTFGLSIRSECSLISLPVEDKLDNTKNHCNTERT